jgi:hypothetical protein
MILNTTNRPNSRDKVTCRCYKCGDKKENVYKEHVRTVNRQSILVEYYHCPKCYRSLIEYRQLCREKSISSLHLILEGSSERSKLLWADKDYRRERLEYSQKLKSNKEFSEKVSESVKKKFREDNVYRDKVCKARMNKSSDFIARCVEIHDNYYDYTLVDYKGVDINIIIICPVHGQFAQLPSNHVKGHGCPLCGIENNRLRADDFIERCRQKHNNRYNYDNTEYISLTHNIDYFCAKHGFINQLAQNHLRGSGCRFCDSEKTSSNGEAELAEYISSLTYCERNNRIILDGLELDIVINNKVAIEYQGLYWHSYNRPESKSERYRHYNKLELAKSRGISLIQIYENEWLDKKEIVKSMLKSKLGLIGQRVFARNCRLDSLDESTAEDFFNNNHIHGHRRSARYIALELNGQIVCAASFSVIGGRCELIRFCNQLDMMVVGGLSRLLKHSGFNKIFTYVDRRFSTFAKSYLACGFSLVGITQPGYQYYKSGKLFSRQSFQKSKLSKKLKSYDPILTEAQNMFNNGYRRIWNAGHYKMELDK